MDNLLKQVIDSFENSNKLLLKEKFKYAIWIWSRYWWYYNKDWIVFSGWRFDGKWEIPTNKTDNGKYILTEIADFINRTIETKGIEKVM